MPSIQVFSDVIMPRTLVSAGIRGRNVRRNTRTSARNGRMQINVDSDWTQRQYDFGVIPITVAQWQTIEGLHNVTKGGAYGFLLEDPKDSKALITEGKAVLITGNTYQLLKRYTSVGGSRTDNRTITRPIASSFVIKAAGVPLTVTTQYTLDTATGIVTIPSAPTDTTLTWSGGFYVPVHFMSDVIDWDLARAGGDDDDRLIAGPDVVLNEVIE